MRATTGVRRITGTSPKVRAWSCSACGMDWAISVVNPHMRPGYLAELGVAAREIGRLRWALRQVIALADDAPTSTDQQLRHRLLALAARCEPREGLRSSRCAPTTETAPQGFHEQLADYRANAQVGSTLLREMEEELFGREDVDNTVTDQRCLDPMHPSRLSGPMV